MTPLAGVRILDLSRLLPGAACTRLLRDLGAEVIKVERPGVGDDVRHEQPSLPGASSAPHQFLDGGKRSVALDLKDPDDVAVVHGLVRQADAVLESFRPGVADRLGVGYAQLARINPALVYVSLTGYGQTGPRAAAAGHDIDYCAYTGVLGTVGHPDTGPALSGVLAADMMGGTLAATSILAGVVSARASGQGAHVDLSLQEAALWAVALPMAQHLADGTDWSPQRGMLNGALPCYNVYRCADGAHLAVGALEPRFWQRLVGLIGREDLVDRRDDPTAVGELRALFAGEPRGRWLELLEDADVCVAPINDLAAGARDPQLQARGAFPQVEGDGWALRQPGMPIRFGDEPVRRTPAPELGADTGWARDAARPGRGPTSPDV